MAMTDRELLKEMWDAHKTLRQRHERLAESVAQVIDRMDFLERAFEEQTELLKRSVGQVDQMMEQVDASQELVTRMMATLGMRAS